MRARPLLSADHSFALQSQLIVCSTNASILETERALEQFRKARDAQAQRFQANASTIEADKIVVDSVKVFKNLSHVVENSPPEVRTAQSASSVVLADTGVDDNFKIVTLYIYGSSISHRLRLSPVQNVEDVVQYVAQQTGHRQEEVQIYDVRGRPISEYSTIEDGAVLFAGVREPVQSTPGIINRPSGVITPTVESSSWNSSHRDRGDVPSRKLFTTPSTIPAAPSGFNSAAVVMLKVQQEKFYIPTDSLSKYPNCLMSQWLQQETSAEMELSCDPETFQHVVNFMKEDVLVLSDEVNRVKLVSTAKYLNLPELLDKYEFLNHKLDLTRQEVVELICKNRDNAQMNDELLQQESEELNSSSVDSVLSMSSFDSKKDSQSFDFTGFILSGLNLANLSLRQCTFDRCHLLQIDLSHCDLTRTSMRHVNLRQANLCGANLTQADLHHADLRGANLRNVLAINCNFSKCNLREADFSDANVEASKFIDADLTSCVLSLCRPPGATFAGATLNGTQLDRSRLRRCVGSIPSQHGTLRKQKKQCNGLMVSTKCQHALCYSCCSRMNTSTSNDDSIGYRRSENHSRCAWRLKHTTVTKPVSDDTAGEKQDD